MLGRSQIGRRMQAILDGKRRRTRLSGGTVLSLVLAAMVATLPLGMLHPTARAQDAGIADDKPATTQPAVTTNQVDPLTAVLDARRANLERLKNGVLVWTRHTINDGFGEPGAPRQETYGAYKMWWDGERCATAAVYDQAMRGPEGQAWTERRNSAMAYDGRGVKPHTRDAENYLNDVVKLTGPGSLEALLPEIRKQPGHKLDWSYVDAAGSKLVRLHAKGQEDTWAEETYDLDRGGNLVKQVWYAASGDPYMIQNVESVEVAPNTWLPRLTVFKSGTDQDKPALMQRYELLPTACIVNDASVIPENIFSGNANAVQQRCQDELLEIYRAMQLVDQRNAAEKAKDEVRESISTYVKAALAGDEETMKRHLPAQRQAKAASEAKDMREIVELGATPSILQLIRVDGDYAQAASDFFALKDSRYDGMRCMTFELQRVDDHWVIRDIDIEDLEGLVNEVKRFEEDMKRRKDHPRVPATVPR